MPIVCSARRERGKGTPANLRAQGTADVIVLLRRGRGYAPDEDLNSGRRRCPLENLGQGTGKAGHHVLTAQRLVQGQDLLGAVVAIYAGYAPGRVQHPDEAGPGGEPVGDLGPDLAGAIAGRQNLDDEVGGEIGEARGLGIGESASADECSVRTADRVRIAGELEPRLRVDAPERGRPHVRAEP